MSERRITKSEAEWLIAQMSDEQRGRFFTIMREMTAALANVCEAVANWEAKGIAAAETHANEASR